MIPALHHLTLHWSMTSRYKTESPLNADNCTAQSTVTEPNQTLCHAELLYHTLFHFVNN